MGTTLNNAAMPLSFLCVALVMGEARARQNVDQTIAQYYVSDIDAAGEALAAFDEHEFVVLSLHPDGLQPNLSAQAPAGYHPIDAIFVPGNCDLLAVSQKRDPQEPHCDVRITRLSLNAPEAPANDNIVLDEFKAIGANEGSYVVVSRRSGRTIVQVRDPESGVVNECVAANLKDAATFQVAWDDRERTWRISFVSPVASGGKMPLRKNEIHFGFMKVTDDGRLVAMETWNQPSPQDIRHAWISDHGTVVGLTASTQTELFDIETGLRVKTILHPEVDAIHDVDILEDLTSLCIVSNAQGNIDVALYPTSEEWTFAAPDLPGSTVMTCRILMAGNRVIISSRSQSLFQNATRSVSAIRKLDR